jgi:hypothetical protein
MAGPEKAPPQLSVVIDFAIEYKNGISVIADQRLVSADEIDNSETHCT